MQNIKNSFTHAKHLLATLSICIALSACVGTIIETATDATLAVAKAPFKVGGAIVDVVDGDDDD